MSDRQRLILLLLALLIFAAFVAWFVFAVLTTPAYACHRYSQWYYPWPQPRCAARMAQMEAIVPPPKPTYMELPGNPDIDIPLPSLEGMEFPPDCMADWCQRMKGIGLLREKFGTN